MTQHSSLQHMQAYRRHFRHYSRLVRRYPTHEHYHQKRIQVALQMAQQEPLQGALADYFYACWYLMPSQGREILQKASVRLSIWVIQEFEHFINQGHYLPTISKLATRWSVLVSPSLDVPNHLMYVSKDDAETVAKEVCLQLLDARKNKDAKKITQIEQEFFSHCMACQDRMGFMRVWFELSKHDWQFGKEWLSCRDKLISL